MKPRILYVDDDPGILEAYKVRLSDRFELTTAPGGSQALETIRAEGPFEVILADMRMPGMDGVQLLREVREIDPDSVRIILTGNADLTSAIQAVNEGNIFRFLTKPCPSETLTRALQAGVEQYRLVTAEREMMSKTVRGAIKVLMDVLSMISPVTFSLADRLKRSVPQIAHKLNLPDPWLYELAAMLSQLGCVALMPDTVDHALAGMELTAEDRDAFNLHPEIASSLLGNIPRLEEVSEIVAHQLDDFVDLDTNEDLLARDRIAVGAQLLRVATEFERLSAGHLTTAQAMADMLARPKEFDPQIVAALEDVQIGHQGLDLRVVSMDDLCPRMTLDQDVHASDGRLLVTKGMDVTFPILARLRMWQRSIGIREPIRVYVPKPSTAMLAQTPDA
jgi:response regulator RpfG family c-di-GMP phosphodiesterase